MSENQTNPSPGLLRIVVLLLGSDWLELVLDIWKLAKRVLSFQAHEGMYEVLDYAVQLELADPGGEKAIYHKRQKVRFLQDNIIAYQDQAWGDGDIFAEYKCSPGVPVDPYREGHRYRILISLRETKRRDDVEEFHIERTIRHGFCRDTEDFQTEIDHTTRKLTLSLIFPTARPPKHIYLIEKNTNKHTALGPEHFQKLPDGRQQVTWKSEHPRLFEAYILRWVW